MSHDARLRREYRLLRRDQFDFVLNAPRVRANRFPLLVMATPNGLEHARIGLVIGKRSARLAVERNGIKRVVRESFRQTRSTMPAFDVVIMLRKRADQSVTNATLRESLLWLWARVQNSGG